MFTVFFRISCAHRFSISAYFSLNLRLCYRTVDRADYPSVFEQTMNISYGVVPADIVNICQMHAVAVYTYSVSQKSSP